ncbi:MAG: GNAT family N-acetyltransferase [Faecousia sp.]
MSPEEYLMNPCRMASIPYWKAKSISIPDGMKILHHKEWNETEYAQYIDEPYFRLRHNLKDLSVPVPPQGYSIRKAAVCEFAAHISSCHDGIGITEAELHDYTQRRVYNANFWLAVKDDQTGKIIATAIGELDAELGEGVLEWIQVSGSHRGQGLGCYLVCELLWRMKDVADFATVSGQCRNPTNPEGLYRKCDFTGSDVWHILRKRA